MLKKSKAILMMLLLVIIPQQAYAVEEITKKLELKENHSHLLFFEDRIIRHKAGDSKAFDIEVLQDIYKDRHEMLVKPMKVTNTNLIVWTKKRVYNFEVKVKSINKGFEGFDFFEIDLPPGLD